MRMLLHIAVIPQQVEIAACTPAVCLRPPPALAAVAVLRVAVAVDAPPFPRL